MAASKLPIKEGEGFMQKKSLLPALLFCVIHITPLYPASVSFLVIETGLPRESPTNQYTITWENTLLDVFFESGHIVTNSPILRLTQKPEDGFPNVAERDFEEARDGRMDYFLVAIVNYPAPRNVSLRLFRTNSQELVMEHTYTDRTYRTGREEQDAIINAVMTFAGRVR